MKTGLDIYTENVVFPSGTPMVSSCPNEQSCQNCSDKEPTEKEPR